MPKYSNRDFWIGFWVSSSIFRPQQVPKLIQTQNEPVFRPPGSQNQRHRVKMWSPKTVLSISACVKTCLLVLYRILWPNSVSALRKKNHRLLTAKFAVSDWSLVAPVYFVKELAILIRIWWVPTGYITPEWVLALRGSKQTFAECLGVCAPHLMTFQTNRTEFWDTFWDNLHWFTVTSTRKFPRLSQLWDHLSPSSRGVRSSD